jgi:hypothetical protein
MFGAAYCENACTPMFPETYFPELARLLYSQACASQAADNLANGRLVAVSVLLMLLSKPGSKGFSNVSQETKAVVTGVASGQRGSPEAMSPKAKTKAKEVSPLKSPLKGKVNPAPKSSPSKASSSKTESSPPRAPLSTASPAVGTGLVTGEGAAPKSFPIKEEPGSICFIFFD